MFHSETYLCWFWFWLLFLLISLFMSWFQKEKLFHTWDRFDRLISIILLISNVPYLVIKSCHHEERRFRGVWNASPPFAKCFALICLTKRRCLMCVESIRSSLKPYLQKLLEDPQRWFHLSSPSFYCLCNHFALFGCQCWLLAERGSKVKGCQSLFCLLLPWKAERIGFRTAVRSLLDSRCWSRKFSSMEAAQGFQHGLLPTLTLTLGLGPWPLVCCCHKCVEEPSKLELCI